MSPDAVSLERYRRPPQEEQVTFFAPWQLPQVICASSHLPDKPVVQKAVRFKQATYPSVVSIRTSAAPRSLEVRTKTKNLVLCNTTRNPNAPKSRCYRRVYAPPTGSANRALRDRDQASVGSTGSAIVRMRDSRSDRGAVGSFGLIDRV